jgi:hypothetical protein
MLDGTAEMDLSLEIRLLRCQEAIISFELISYIRYI